MSRARRLSLYHRRGCRLCDEMLEAVERLCHGSDVEISVVDIDSDAALKSRYDREIPVLVAGEVEICRHRLDPERLRDWLSSR